MVFMDKGQVVEIGSPREVLDAPKASAPASSSARSSDTEGLHRQSLSGDLDRRLEVELSGRKAPKHVHHLFDQASRIRLAGLLGSRDITPLDRFNHGMVLTELRHRYTIAKARR